MLHREAVLDANVFLYTWVRDVLLDAALADLYRARWTDMILAEVRRNFIGRWGTADTADRLLAELERAFPHALISGHGGLITRMTNDPKDRHVVAAAAHVGADVLTFNTRHFRAADLAPFGVRALTPDTFLMELYAAAPDVLVAIVRAQVAQRQHPPLTLAAYLDTLAAPLPRFTVTMRERLKNISRDLSTL